MQDRACRRADGKTAGIGNGMVHPDEFHREIPDLHRIAGLHRHQFGRIVQIVLSQFVFNDSDGQLGAENRRVDQLEQIRNSAHMVLVPVGDENTL